MKEFYAEPIAEVIELDTTDVITTSGGLEGCDVYEFNPELGGGGCNKFEGDFSEEF